MTGPTLFTGGPIITMDTNQPRAEAIATLGRHIVAVGELGHCRAALQQTSSATAQQINLDGRALLPGFVDPHCHPVMFGQMLAWTSVTPAEVNNIDDIVTRMTAAASRAKLDTPVRGYGYEHRNLSEGRHPSRYDLDRVATDREVYVMNASGHGGVVNSFTLSKYGIDRGTPDPAGGQIERDQDGEPTGALWDAACDRLTGSNGVKVGHHGPNFHIDEPAHVMREHLNRAQERFLAVGVTSVADAQVSRREMETYLSAHADAALRIRVNAYVLSSLLDELLSLGLTRPLGDDYFRFAGLKCYADGTLGGWTAYFPEGYAADPCRHGVLYHDPAEYSAIIQRAHAVGLQICTHAQSPTAIQLVLDAVEQAQRQTPRLDARHRIEHCGLPTIAQIQQMAVLGIHPVSQSQHHYNWGEGVLSAVGPEVGQRFNPLGEFVAAGVPITLSSDAPVAEPNPLQAVMAAVTRVTARGTTLGPPSLRITVEQALQAHTIAGARAMHREDQVGSLRPGKLADLVLLDADPTDVPTSKLTDVSVVDTYLAGAPVG